MATARYDLTSSASCRAYDDRALLVDHASGEILELNASAGRVLDLVWRGEEIEDPDDVEFASSLVERGLAVRRGGSESGGRAAPRRDDPPPEGGDLLEEINRWAAERLIPLHCQIELTHRCGLHCRHCFLSGAAAHPERELSFDEISGFLSDLSDLGGLFLLLTGGEPFSRSDLERIVGRARDLRFAVSILTSGDGVEPDAARRLAGLGLDGVQVSLYGPDAATHDALTRVPGSFDAALGCLRLFRDLGVATRAGVTVTRESARSARRIRDLLDREGLEGVLGLYLEPRLDGSRDPQDLAVDRDGMRTALEAFPPAEDHRMSGKGPDDPPCGAGANVLAVDPFGSVRPCLPLRIEAGSIRESPLAEIWRSSPALERIRRIRLADLSDCPGCEIRGTCDRCAAFAVAEGLPVTGHSAFDCALAEVAASVSSAGIAES